jgi:hypothetical protein
MSAKRLIGLHIEIPKHAGISAHYPPSLGSWFIFRHFLEATVQTDVEAVPCAGIHSSTYLWFSTHLADTLNGLKAMLEKCGLLEYAEIAWLMDGEVWQPWYPAGQQRDFARFVCKEELARQAEQCRHTQRDSILWWCLNQE